ncbi:glycoside hydrolase family 16 protein [Punctularia strigosozonata HHB-11173 SS5]|uniref:glycoside hydrolase family 16 protein n=1 Tax=Punctularia strigosozonata (strain HHB-11173) TaxID=741275 RepID=UPI00044167E9|nr:glycoside hydrolase family 16 protein [Punctularia strigosozonata HHB-11173 SS5]EIN08533.1 glycoside hydrolase family 16 protein [Punctularia strigosozonata HHB-11173 SS5]
MTTLGVSTALVIFAGSLQGARAQATCNSTSPCGSDAPCCSEFGFCGSDDFCLGGCNPLASNTLDSCLPNPVCKDATYTFPDLSRVFSNGSLFDGNASAYDFIVDKGNIMNTNQSGGELAMLLTEDNGGTRLSSTRYMQYGTVSAKLKTGRWGGVVTAFITMSNIRDEIDWEFPGNTTTEGQTNYFWQGYVPDPNNGKTIGNLTDTFSNYHEYTIDWQPDVLTFLIDSKPVRTLNKNDTLDAQGVAHYPMTPARVQLSIWPAGLNSTSAGTVAWSGGLIDWNDPDYVAAGHFYALVSEVSVKCANVSGEGANVTSYVYGANSTAFTPSISFSNQSTLVNGAMDAVRLPVWTGVMLAGLWVVATQLI